MERCRKISTVPLQGRHAQNNNYDNAAGGSGGGVPGTPPAAFLTMAEPPSLSHQLLLKHVILFEVLTRDILDGKTWPLERTDFNINHLGSTMVQRPKNLERSLLANATIPIVASMMHEPAPMKKASIGN